MKHPRETIASVALILCAIAAVIWHRRLGADFVPLDASRLGPNLVSSAIQAAVLVVVAALIYPPVRRTVHRFVDRKLHAIHLGFDRVHRKLDAHHAHQAQHDGWVHDALHAMHHGDPLPPHPYLAPPEKDDPS